MSTNYIVPARRATAVSHAVVGYFTASDELNLIMAKINRLHVYNIGKTGLKSIQEVPIYGRIVAMQLFRLQKEKTDSLVVLTDKHHMAILGWNKETDSIRTRASGCIADRVGRQSDHGQIVTVHKNGLLIAVRIYDSILKIIKWSDGKDLRTFNVRLDDPTIIDIIFLNGEDSKFCYISHNQFGRHLKFVELNVQEKEMRTLFKCESIENEASMVIAVPSPYSGAIIVGQQSIMYTNQEGHSVTTSPSLTGQMRFNCYAYIDKINNRIRYLLGDDEGRLFMLLIDTDPSGSNTHKQVKEMRLELLGETSIAECLVYLDNGVVFVGSRFGDSQLIRLVTEKVNGSFVQILDTFINLAPIRDMVLVENDGQTQLVTCSGAFKDGSLRFIRNGIGIEEQATVELPGIKGLFALRVYADTDDYLLVSFSDESQAFHLDEGELEGRELFDLVTDQPTLWAGCLGESRIILQATPKLMRLCGENMKSKDWIPPNGHIDKVSVNAKSGEVAVVCGSNLYYVQCTEEGYQDVAMRQMSNEISCIDISPLGDNIKSSLVAVGFWQNYNIALFSLPTLELAIQEALTVEVLPRDILMAYMENIMYLLVALGDGTLFYYVIDPDTRTLRDFKKTTLGTLPPSLHHFVSNGQAHVFVCSDRPAVIFASNGKLVFSNVNLKLLTHICSLNSAYYKDCLVMTEGETLCIGTVDDIQKLHIRTVPLGESPNRIAHQQETSTFAILVMREEHSERISISQQAQVRSPSRTDAAMRANIAEPMSEIHSLVILDHNTHHPLHSYEFMPNEHAISLISAQLGEDKNSPFYYIVGTAIVHNEETEAKLGKIYIFQAGYGDEKTRLKKISEKEVKGAPYSMSVLGSKLLVAVNSSIRLFDWPDAEKPELRLECSHFNHIAAICVKVQGDQIVVGDLMRSMCIITFKSMEGIFEEVARDFRCIWMSAVEFIDAETILGADASYNLLTGEVDRTQAEEKQKLKDASDFYLGEMVNTFRKGSLVGTHVDSQVPVSKPILYGTIDGSIGIIVQLTEEYHKFFTEVEKVVAKETHNCLRVSHSTYRQFSNQRISCPSRGFVDGDLVESVLEWPREKARSLFSNFTLPSGYIPSCQSTSDDVLKIIEEISRIH